MASLGLPYHSEALPLPLLPLNVLDDYIPKKPAIDSPR